MDEHTDKSRYARYHSSVYLPALVSDAAVEFLPSPGTPLRPSRHYQEVSEQRRSRLPLDVWMPREYEIIEVALVRATMAVWRVTIRFRWNKRTDLTLVIEGDYEIVTGFFANRGDLHESLDEEVYEHE